MKILLGVDLSAHSRETVSLVCRVPWPAGTQVLALSVVAPSEPQFVPQPQVLAAVAGNLAVIESRELDAHDELITNTVAALRGAGLKAEGKLLSGNPSHRLVETAASEHADLLVVGSHGHSGLRRFAMGSVAAYVTQHAPCSVLVVRRDIPEFAG